MSRTSRPKPAASVLMGRPLIFAPRNAKRSGAFALVPVLVKRLSTSMSPCLGGASVSESPLLSERIIEFRSPPCRRHLPATNVCNGWKASVASGTGLYRFSLTFHCSTVATANANMSSNVATGPSQSCIISESSLVSMDAACTVTYPSAGGNTTIWKHSNGSDGCPQWVESGHPLE